VRATAVDDGRRSLRAHLEASAAAKAEAARSEGCIASLQAIAEAVARALAGGKKVLLCGNGGSAADAQHVATELVVRLSGERPARRALPAIALTTDTSLLTACANDLGFPEVFARQVQALGRPGDVLIGISTSGNSANVVRAFEAAGPFAIVKVLFTGGTGGRLLGLSDLAFVAPTADTQHIQEVHLAAYHAVCALVEDRLRELEAKKVS